MKIIKLPFETKYTCVMCGCEFEIEPNGIDVYIDTKDWNTPSGHITRIYSFTAYCPFCNSAVQLKKRENNNLCE